MFKTLPSAVQGHEHYPGPHDDEQGLEGRVVLEGLQGGALHGGEGVVVGLRILTLYFRLYREH